MGDLIRIADLRKMFAKGDSITWSCNLYETTEIIIGLITSYKNNELPETYNEALQRKTKLTSKENDTVMKNEKSFGSNQIAFVHHCLYLLICLLKLEHIHISQQEHLQKI